MIVTHSLTGERRTSVSSLRMRNTNPNTVSFSDHTDSVEVGDVSHNYVTLPALESGVNKLFRGLWWLKLLLVLCVAGLFVGGFLLPTLQGLDLDEEEFEDISEPRKVLEDITSKSITVPPLEVEAFEGTRTGKILRIPIAGPTIYMERIVDPAL